MGGSFTNPKILSPDEAEKLLPIPCYMILSEVAQPVFPLGNRSRPSSFVVIMPIKSNSVSSILPISIDWRQWKSAIVPVLQDEQWRITNPIVSSQISTGDLSGYLNLLGKALRESFIRSGWGPS